MHYGNDMDPDTPQYGIHLPDSSDPFVILNINNRQAKKGEIKRAYRRAALLFHPDVRINTMSTQDERQRAHEDFARINAAYSYLTGKEEYNYSSMAPPSRGYNNNHQHQQQHHHQHRHHHQYETKVQNTSSQEVDSNVASNVRHGNYGGTTRDANSSKNFAESIGERVDTDPYPHPGNHHHHPGDFQYHPPRGPRRPGAGTTWHHDNIHTNTNFKAKPMNNVQPNTLNKSPDTPETKRGRGDFFDADSFHNKWNANVNHDVHEAHEGNDWENGNYYRDSHTKRGDFSNPADFHSKWNSNNSMFTAKNKNGRGGGHGRGDTNPKWNSSLLDTDKFHSKWNANNLNGKVEKPTIHVHDINSDFLHIHNGKNAIQSNNNNNSHNNNGHASQRVNPHAAQHASEYARQLASQHATQHANPNPTPHANPHVNPLNQQMNTQVNTQVNQQMNQQMNQHMNQQLNQHANHFASQHMNQQMNQQANSHVSRQANSHVNQQANSHVSRQANPQANSVRHYSRPNNVLRVDSHNGKQVINNAKQAINDAKQAINDAKQVANNGFQPTTRRAAQTPQIPHRVRLNQQPPPPPHNNINEKRYGDFSNPDDFHQRWSNGPQTTSKGNGRSAQYPNAPHMRINTTTHTTQVKNGHNPIGTAPNYANAHNRPKAATSHHFTHTELSQQKHADFSNQQDLHSRWNGQKVKYDFIRGSGDFSNPEDFHSKWNSNTGTFGDSHKKGHKKRFTAPAAEESRSHSAAPRQKKPVVEDRRRRGDFFDADQFHTRFNPEKCCDKLKEEEERRKQNQSIAKKRAEELAAAELAAELQSQQESSSSPSSPCPEKDWSLHVHPTTNNQDSIKETVEQTTDLNNAKQKWDKYGYHFENQPKESFAWKINSTDAE